MTNKYFGLDLSFSGTGIVHFDFDPSKSNATLSNFDSGLISVSPLGKKIYTNLYAKSTESAKQILSFIKEHLDKKKLKNTYIVIEHPIPTAQFSAGLWLLTTRVFDELASLGIEDIYISPVQLLTILVGKSKRSKKDILTTAQPLKEDLKVDIKDNNINDAFLHSLMFIKDYPSISSILVKHSLKEKYDRCKLAKYNYKTNQMEN